MENLRLHILRACVKLEKYAFRINNYQCNACSFIGEKEREIKRIERVHIACSECNRNIFACVPSPTQSLARVHCSAVVASRVSF